MTDERLGPTKLRRCRAQAFFGLSTSQARCYVITLPKGGQQAFGSSLWLISVSSFSIGRCRHLRSITGVSRVQSAILFVVAIQEATLEQDKGILDSTPLRRPANPDGYHLVAKELFGCRTLRAPTAVRSVGFCRRGCLADAQALPVNGRT